MEFRVEDGGGDVEVETPWAEPLGYNRYRLENSPFYAYGVSWQYVVEATVEDKIGFSVFRKVVAKSGHRTVWVMYDPPARNGNVSQPTLDGIVALGCNYEGANPSFIAVDIPPETNLPSVYEFLNSKDPQWEHADPTHAELYPDG